MAINVVSRKFYGHGGIYIARPSLLGNPFVIGKDRDREEVIAKYRVWLWHQVKARGAVFGELVRIKKLADRQDLQLVCWCRPKLACHGDVIKACLEWMQAERIE